MAKIKNKNKNERLSFKKQSICPNCKKEGSHFAPPSLGEDGFWICDLPDFNPPESEYENIHLLKNTSNNTLDKKQ